MIYCVVDVDFYDHPKFHEVGHDGVGMWLFGLAYSRKHRLDGRVLKSVAMAHMGDRRNAAIIKKLLDSGLWLELDEKHYFVVNYAEKGNQTKAQIEEAQAKARDRQKKARDKRESATVRAADPVACHADVTPSVTDDVTRDSHVAPVEDETRESHAPSSCSTRSSISESQQIGSETRAADLDPPSPIGLDEPLTDERRAYARSIGLTDTDRVWAKFLGKYAEWGKKTASVDGSWRAFCANELPIQRRERERERAQPAQGAPIAIGSSYRELGAPKRQDGPIAAPVAALTASIGRGGTQ